MRHPPSIAMQSAKANDLRSDVSFQSETVNFVGERPRKSKNKRMLEPLTDIKPSMNKTETSFMPSPHKLPTQKLIPLKDRDDIKKEVQEECHCEEPELTAK